MSGAGDDRAVDVVNGALVKPLVLLSLPIVVTNLLQVGYNLADTFWVGRLGQAAVSAISFSWAIVFLVIALAAGFTVAGTVLVAQNKGAGNTDRIASVAGQTITFVVVVSAVLSVVGYAAAPWLLQLVGAPPGSEEFALSLAYTRTMFLGLPFVFGFFIFQALLQGWGDTRTPLYLMAFGVFLNVVADPFFILGFEGNVLFAWTGLESLEASLYAATGFSGFGVRGAALATIITRGIGAAIGVALLLSGRVGISLSPSDFVLRSDTVRKIVRIGAPASVERSMVAVSTTVVTALVALVGADAVAGYGIGTRVTSMVVLPALGLARGVETVVGQNLGADQPDRAERGVYAATAIIVVCLLALSAGVYAFAEPIVGVFITGESAAEVIAIGGDYLRVVGASYVFMGVFYVVQGGFRGSGSTRLAMVFAFFGFIVFRASLAYALVGPLDMGAMGVWYGVAAANALMAAAAGLYFLRGTWADGVVDPTSPNAAPSDD
ncbi:MATE family efflux transporter [Halostella sp. JP-L12]|uniref:MATE family efflux transporter n=1 Tax=Halostella TaxID=1843185 RepID=UPI000EF7A639|nr:MULTISPECIES: MATE family efflux transporter [Halostella]NHN48426.1 MATE family efflux transporter [Halostella sp. JP-L12]